jgi:hypothetical protein
MLKKAIVITLVLVLPGICSAAGWWDKPGLADTTTISSLPYTVPTSGTSSAFKVYRLSGNLTSNNGGITVDQKSYVKILGRGYTITFNRDSSSGENGVYINQSNHIVVENLTATQFRTGTLISYSYGGSDNTGLNIGSNAKYVRIINCNFHVTGYDSRVVDATGDGWEELEIHGGNYTTFSRSFEGRQSGGSAVMAFPSSYADPTPDSFNIWVSNVTIDSACHAGVLCGGVAFVDSNHITIDAYNATGGTWANAHALADRGNCWAGSHFNYNVVRTGTAHGGGRGFYFNETAGTIDKPVEMAYNDINVTQGSNGEDNDARGLRLRWGNNYLRVHHNKIVVSADDNAATPWKESGAHGIWLSEPGDPGYDTGAYNWLYNNEIHANWDGTGAPKAVYCIVIDNSTREGTPQFSNRSFNNHLYSDVRCLQLGGSAYPGTFDFVSYRDTLDWESPQWTDGWGWKGAVGMGGYTMDATNNWLIDPIFINATVDNVVNHSGSGTKSISVQRSVKIAVQGSNGLPVTGAAVHIWPKQAYADSSNVAKSVASKVTSSGGLVYDTLAYKFLRWVSSTQSDSLYSDYRVRAVKGTDTVWARLALGDKTAPEGNYVPVNLTLSRTVGDGTWGSTDVSLSVADDSKTEGNSLLFIVSASEPPVSGVTFQYATQNGTAVAPGDYTSTSGTGSIPAGQTKDTVVVPTVNDATYTGTRTMSLLISNPSGGATLGRATAVGTIIDNEVNDTIPPSPPVLHSPTQGSVINSTTPTLSVLNGTDPNGDPLTYRFELLDSAGSSLIASVDDAAPGASYTTWTVPSALSDQTTYSWHARCTDGRNTSAWMSLARFTVDTGSEINSPPTLPIHASPSDGETLDAKPIILTIDNSLDADGDAVTYDFFVYGDQALTELLEEQLAVAQTSNQTSVTLTLDPVSGHSYWWRTRASDGTETTNLTTATRFAYLSLVAGGQDYIPTPTEPRDGEVVYVDRPLLAVVNVVAPGDYDYYFQVATDSDFADVVEESEPIPQSGVGSTEWQVTGNLPEGHTYYWRARAGSYQYSEVANFAVEFKVFAYPNPVHFGRGESVTFRLPDKPADILIQTVSGETVLIKPDVSGEWSWNGRNASGNLVAVGVYSWFVRGTGYNGKIVAVP